MNNINSNILSRTRAEEHDADVWNSFYIPPYFDRLNLTTATKSTYFVGKRGCGKTMLLKYLSYQTKFSRKRDDIPQDEIQHIGIYWRIDTHFCGSMFKRNKTEHEWINIFQNYFSLVISTEICKALYYIAKSPYKYFNTEDYEAIQLNALADYGIDIPTNLPALEKYLIAKYRNFNTWISNIESFQPQIYPPGLNFLDTFISSLKSNSPLQGINFYIYLDEIENLLNYQRRFMNTVLKHSQKPLIVNFTSKVFIEENMTIGNESINGTHDYIYRELDSLMTDEERKRFFSEVFINNYYLAKEKENYKNFNLVIDETKINERNDPEYVNELIDLMRHKFPSLSYKEMAEQAIDLKRINTIIGEKLSILLKNSKYSEKDFRINNFQAQAFILLPFLLSRKNNNPDSIYNEYIKYHSGEKSKFENWIPNNLFGALLELYRPFNNNKCPLYSGFDTFYTMANGNLRHFLILCYKTLEINEMFELSNDQFSIDIQAHAAYESSNALIKEIRTLGKFGEKLRLFTLRLGNIFKTLQENPALSEPEQNQFTINSGDRNLSDDEIEFLEEAKKHSILIEMVETKTKNKYNHDILDYLLNPIYSPYFNISYRKKRKIEISVEDFACILNGTESDYRLLLSSISKQGISSQTLPIKQLGFFDE
ncbi:hypothetical protein A1Z85_RS10910 [Acinetobacter baumannii]|uniref:ORC-CDC6 family AAA ATPase n=1 Tax=Acinetobacter baumannii TaxID=470 RepID=UPI00028DEBF8|nr:hypothetical protein [Acinetobacter baumannii]EHU1441306.1 hypothetical protein [Acinetobacter baumannii]EHU1809126.1 hypothetical protein [Acinetobacter baumannii]EHU2698514.1 hypothetical protein [Acinetobacter baumannii]EKL59539.1 hypothetical protein ACIN5110_2367 [Acinetobacter baumannii OIFC110]MDC5288112.1 hypothetical protein [Acinetobacter baumannii]